MNARGSTTGAKNQDAKWFTSDLQQAGGASGNSPTLFLATVAVGTASTQIQVTYDGGATWNLLEQGNLLVQNAIYIWTFVIRSGDLFNFKTPTAGGATVNMARVTEAVV